jgi:hypothetical protein
MKFKDAPAGLQGYVTESMWGFDEIDAFTGERRASRHLVGWGGRIRTFNLLIQSNTRYRQSSFRIELPRLISELRSGSASEARVRIWREFGEKVTHGRLRISAVTIT